MSGQILKNVSRGSFYLAAEQFSGLVSGVVYSIVVLRWLGPEGYGLLSLALAMIGLASIATGNFEVFLERFAAEYETRGRMRRLQRAHLLALGLKLGLGALAALVLAAIAGWLGTHYGEPRLAHLLWVLIGIVVLEGLTVTGRAVLFGLQRFGWVAGVALVFHVVKIVAVTALWLQGAGILALAGALVLLAAANGLVLTVLAGLFVRRGREAVGEPLPEPMRLVGSEEETAAAVAPAPEPEPTLLRTLLQYCLPLLGARAAYLTGQNLSRVVLGGFLSLEQLGYFSFAFTVVERFVGFVYALPSSLLPSLTQLVAAGERLRFGRLVDKAFRLVATAASALSFGIFVFAEELTLLVGGPEYLPAVPVLRVMALVPWVRTAQQPITMTFYALRHTTRVLALAVLKLGTELGSYFLLIPLLGTVGAAWSHVAGAGVAFAGALLWIGYELAPSQHRWAVMGKTTGIFFGAAAATLAVGFWNAGFAASLGVKLGLLVPGFLVAVFLFDLVTEDDLRRAASIEIRAGWMRRLRDFAVARALWLSRRLGPWRPSGVATAEGN